MKTKFNIKKCAKCKYHGTILSRTLGNVKNISCDYAALAHEGTCITRSGEDKRGNDPDNCRLFEAGKSLARAKKNMTI